MDKTQNKENAERLNLEEKNVERKCRDREKNLIKTIFKNVSFSNRVGQVLKLGGRALQLEHARGPRAAAETCQGAERVSQIRLRKGSIKKHLLVVDMSVAISIFIFYISSLYEMYVLCEKVIHVYLLMYSSCAALEER